jgi:flagellar assembly protein FliH
MKWSDPICFSRPLRDVRLLTGAPDQDWDELLREREEAALQRGRREGENALGQQLVQQRAELAELQNGILTSLRNALPQVIQQAETDLIHLALEAAQKIVAGMPITAEMVEAVVREALAQAKDTADVSIQLHPDDLALLRKAGAPLLNGTPETGPLRFIPSGEVTRGGCIVQTRFGLIDARREVKLAQMEHSLNS